MEIKILANKTTMKIDISKLYVTIVVPVYNRATLVTKTLNSICSQTYRPIEVIIVDDGSTDGSLDVVRQWKNENEGVDFIVRVLSQANSGAPVARTRGLHAASGEFISFLDSDDLYHPQFVEILLNGIMTNPDADCAICEIQNFDCEPEKPNIYDVNSIHWFRRPLAFGKEFWGTAAALYKKVKLIETGGWNIDLRYGWQDRELCLRLQLQNFFYIRCSLPLVWYRTSSENKISDIAHTRDMRYFIGIANAAKSLIGIAIEHGKIKEAIWLAIRYVKWLITWNYLKYINANRT